MVCKSLNGFASAYPSNVISRNSTRDTTYLINSETDVGVSLFKTPNGQKPFAYLCVHLWNNLEPELKQKPSVFAFKQIL